MWMSVVKVVHWPLLHIKYFQRLLGGELKFGSLCLAVTVEWPISRSAPQLLTHVYEYCPWLETETYVNVHKTFYGQDVMSHIYVTFAEIIISRVEVSKHGENFLPFQNRLSLGNWNRKRVTQQKSSSNLNAALPTFRTDVKEWWCSFNREEVRINSMTLQNYPAL